MDTWLTSEDWILCRVPPKITDNMDSRTVGSQVHLMVFRVASQLMGNLIITHTYSGELRRPPSSFRCRTTPSPPTSKVPLMQTAKMEPNITKL